MEGYHSLPILSKTELFKILPSEAHDVVFKAHRLNELRRLQDREPTPSFIDHGGVVSLFTGKEQNYPVYRKP